MRILPAIVLSLSLCACVSGGSLVQDTSRALARSAVNSAAQQHFPGVDVSPFTDCVINNAETSELMQLAQAASAGSNGATEALPVVKTILARPAASQCLLSSAQTSGLLAGGAGL
jgi:hypothetical protein